MSVFQLRRQEVLDGEQLKAMLAENPARAAQAILMAAKEGIVEGQALLGQILLDGQGIERDPVLAKRWFQIAANAGHLMARNMLGRCWEHGWGGPVDFTLAALEYRQAAESGLDWGLYNVANLLATGRGLAMDQPAALHCYRKAAQMGHAKSMNLLGRYLEQGQYCEKNLAEAYLWYERSAHGGDFRGQFSHASILLEQGDVEGALVWFKHALEGGNLKFLQVGRDTLRQACNADVKLMGEAYQLRIEMLTIDAWLAQD